MIKTIGRTAVDVIEYFHNDMNKAQETKIVMYYQVTNCQQLWDKLYLLYVIS